MGFHGHDGIIEKTEVSNPKWNPIPYPHKLRPCPRCGATQESNRIHMWYVGAIGNGGWRVLCSDCLHFPTRICDTEEEAVNLWNGVDKK